MLGRYAQVADVELSGWTVYRMKDRVGQSGTESPAQAEGLPHEW
jgi:hypothetical protein